MSVEFENLDKRIRVSSEMAYLIGIISIAVAVAFASAANLGMSMIAAPTYILWYKFPFMTMGQWEYVVEGLHLVIFCLVVRKFRLIYLATFATAIFYGAVLDLVRLIPFLNPSIVSSDSLSMGMRITYFVISVFLCAVGVAFVFRTYLFPQVYDFFVKYICIEFELNRITFKRLYDLSMLIISLTLSFILFRGIIGVGVGTFFVVLVNGPLIGAFSKLIDKHIVFYDRFPSLPEHFLIK